MTATGPDLGTRETVARRDAYTCVRCGNPADAAWDGHSIHHRRLRSHPWPGLHEPANLITLCGSGTTGCHGHVHAHPKEARENGWIVSAHQDRPETVPVLTARHGWVLLDRNGGRTPCTRGGEPTGPTIDQLTRLRAMNRQDGDAE